MAWSETDIPDQSGRTAVVTGANSGIGWETARALAAKGARVVLACRSEERGRDAERRIRAAVPSGDVRFEPLDLGSLASVRAFAEKLRAGESRLDLLVNNAGVMMPPYGKTADGFETQLGTNHLGHFALTGLLLEPLRRTARARVVIVSSLAHFWGGIAFDDLQSERSYNPTRAYGQSKLANLLFTYQLHRRLDAKRAETLSVACHPGYAATNLQFAGPRMQGSSLLEAGAGLMNRLFSQSAAMGALPTLYAATVPDVRGGEYFGPGGFAEMWGSPKKVRSSARSHDAADAARLWEISEDATGVRFDALKL